MSNKFAFVILHYNEKTLNDTHECIESLREISKNYNYKIYVVENGSNDTSANLLLKKYSKYNDIKIVISEKNLGFANGNNLGSKEAIKDFQPDFLIVLNNDTYIKQKNFLKKVVDLYLKEDFWVLGPYIYDKNLEPQNPLTSILETKEQVMKSLLYLNLKLKIIKNGEIYYKIFNKIKNLIIKSKKKSLNKIDKGYNLPLHGACLIFSNKYFYKFDEIFDSRTFMYGEEDILYQRLRRHNLKILYSSEIEIYHKEDSSTNKSYQTEYKKEIFILENKIKSLKVLKSIFIGDK